MFGCGSDKITPPPPPTPPPTPPPPIVVSDGSGPLNVLTAVVRPFTTTQAGRLDVTVEWTYAANDVDVYLFRGGCTFEQFIAMQCQVVTFSESSTAKPERLTTSGAAAGSYVLVIANYGPGDESVAYQVVLTPGASAAAADTAASRNAPARIGAYRRSSSLDGR
jgi:hypothetical protein